MAAARLSLLASFIFIPPRRVCRARHAAYPHRKRALADLTLYHC
jgi:hypothetical protein